MQMKLPYPNNTEERGQYNIIIYGQKTMMFFILRIFLGEQVCALCVQFSDSLNRLQQMTLVSVHSCSDLHWLDTLRSKCGYHCN